MAVLKDSANSEGIENRRGKGGALGRSRKEVAKEKSEYLIYEYLWRKRKEGMQSEREEKVDEENGASAGSCGGPMATILGFSFSSERIDGRCWLVRNSICSWLFLSSSSIFCRLMKVCVCESVGEQLWRIIFVAIAFEYIFWREKRSIR